MQIDASTSYPEKSLDMNLFLQKHHSVTELTFYILTLTAVSIYGLLFYAGC